MPSTILVAVILSVFVMGGSPQTRQFLRADSNAADIVAYRLDGGTFKSYGCKPIDPTYWMSGNGHTVTATFAQPETNPSIRVWGMNTDDSVSVHVNGVAYTLTSESAAYLPKVVCGTSPGPNGVLFSDGNLVGANTPGEANFSYQDVVLKAANVTSITVTRLKGAGWGFAGVSVSRVVPTNEKNAKKSSEPGAANKEQTEREPDR